VNFSTALDSLKAGARITRDAWNGPGQWLALRRPDVHSKMTLPYIYISTVTGHLVPWLPSQSDLLAVDWAELGEPGPF
jgi:hypothetical protein